MKKLFVVANWKSNKTVREAEEWIKEFSIFNFQFSNNLEVIICPPFTLLYPLKSLITNYQLPITLGSQNISPFPDGAYTGEISARMLADLGVKYVLVGHSERRKYFAEDNSRVAQKVRMSLDSEMTPIICITDPQQFISISNKLEDSEQTRSIFMFEPPEAISVQVGPVGQGEAEPIEKVVGMIKKMKEFVPDSKFFYGGSVKSHNITDFLSQPEIDGVVAGTASLNAQEFVRMLQNASRI